MKTAAANCDSKSSLMVTWADVSNYANEALLSDLQHTTEVLKRTKLNSEHDSMDNMADIEPIYQEQTRINYNNSQHGLNNIEQMLDDYSMKRVPRDEQYANSSSSCVERPTVQSLLTELEHDNFSSRSFQGQLSPMHENDSLRTEDSRKIQLREPSQLDSMLGTLQKDIAKHGISTIPKGDCASCGKPIVGQVVIALGKMWHPEHYVCCHCGEELGHRNFFERAGKAYCEDDYHEIFSPRCEYCRGPIKDACFRCVTALGKTFHTDHFLCAECGQCFGDEGFHEKNGKAYCRNDFFRMFAPICNGCKNPIKASFITALGTHWHPECFVCQDCGYAFGNGCSFYEHLNVALCETHYHERRGSLCAACRKPISGRCVSAMGQKFHPDHFCCAYCRKQLNKGTFKEVQRKPFCQSCYLNTQ